MIEKEKDISSPEYWKTIYNGERNNAKTDASNFKRPANAFDRFQWLADQVEGPRVIDIASGHATTMKRLRSMHPDWQILCTDQTSEAKKAANFLPYEIMSAYDLINYAPKSFDTVCVSQALEYFKDPGAFMFGAIQVANYFVCTVPDGIMSKWSQLREYNETDFKQWLSKYGEIVHFDKVPGLMLAKVKFS